MSKASCTTCNGTGGTKDTSGLGDCPDCGGRGHSMVNERLLFAAHHGYLRHRAAGLLMSNACLPIACSHTSWTHPGSIPRAEAGFQAAWEATGDVEEFFELLGLRPAVLPDRNADTHPNGLWVYEVRYDPDELPNGHELGDDEDGWRHLRGGRLRRPTAAELEPLARGEAPWGGVLF